MTFASLGLETLRSGDMAKLTDLFDQGDVFLTNGEWLKAMKLGESFLKKYSSLSLLGPLKKGDLMKHHTFQHLVI